MFRRKPGNLPADPTYPSDLSRLGFRVNEKNQFVSTTSRVPADRPWDPTDLTHASHQLPGTFFTPHATSSDRANHVRCKAMDAAAKGEVHRQLTAEFGLKPLYVFDQGSFLDVKPEEPHVQILATGVERLRQRKEVVVVVGEHNQELAVWSRKLVLGREGIDGGSGVGLGKLMRKVWKGGDGWEDGVSAEIEDGGKKLTLGGDDDGLPGLVLLNPGELLYSPTLNKNFSLPAWHARQKESALHDYRSIDEKYNYVAGHSSPAEHVHSVLHNVVPAITHPDVRLYIVGIGDGCEAVMSYFNKHMRAGVEEEASGRLWKLALIQTTHNVDEVDSEEYKEWLASEERVRSYVCSGLPKGTLLAVPEGPNPPKEVVTEVVKRMRILPTEVSGWDADEVASQEPSPSTGQRNGVEGTPSITTETGAEGSIISPVEEMAGSATVDRKEKPADLEVLEEKGSSNPASHANLEKLEPITADLPPLPGSPRLDAPTTQDLATCDPSTPGPSPAGEPDDPSVHVPPSPTGAAAGWDLTPRKPGLWDNDPSASTTDTGSASLTMFSPEAIAEAKRTDGETPYDYTQDPVSCATFSAGIEDVGEMIWPVVMEDIVRWFRGGQGQGMGRGEGGHG